MLIYNSLLSKTLFFYLSFFVFCLFQGVALVLKYVIKGLKVTKAEFDSDGNATGQLRELLDYLEAVDTLKHSTDDQQVARLVEQHQLSYEHIPSIHLNSSEVRTATIFFYVISPLFNQLNINPFDTNPSENSYESMTQTSCFKMI